MLDNMDLSLRRRLVTIAFAAASAFAVFLLIYYWSSIDGFISAVISAFSPIAMGAAVAYVVNILMDFYERQLHAVPWPRARRLLSLMLAIITIGGVATLIMTMILPQLAECIALLVQKLPYVVEQASANPLASMLPEDIREMLGTTDWSKITSQLSDLAVSGLLGNRILENGISSIMNGFIAVVFAGYFLMDKDKFLAQIRILARRVLAGRYESVRHVLVTLNTSMHNYVVGQTVEACILGVLCTFGMLVFGFPYAWMIGTFIGVTALIPVAGCYIGAAVGALMIASVSPLKALWFLVFISVLQQLEGNFIYPRVVGYSLGLGGIWVLGAVTVGGAMFGIPGIMVSVPIVSTMHRLIVEDLIETSLSDDELREWEEASGVKPMKPEAGDDSNYPLLEDMMLKNEPIRKKGIFRRRRKHAEKQDGEPVQQEVEQDESQ